jgi:hypothetical protein
MEKFYSHPVAKDWVVIESLPRGPKQPPHRDFTFPPKFKHLDHERMPAGIIVALEPSAHLFVYGWNRMFPDPHEEVQINLDVGDAIIFRGDLIHAGGSYMSCNLRLHAYLDVANVSRRYNTTYKQPFIRYDQGDLSVCPLHGCDSTPASKLALQRHLGRDHHVRFSNRRVLLVHTPPPATQQHASESDESQIGDFGHAVGSPAPDSSESEIDDFGRAVDTRESEESADAGDSDQSADASMATAMASDVDAGSESSVSSGDFRIFNIAAISRAAPTPRLANAFDSQLRDWQDMFGSDYSGAE